MKKIELFLERISSNITMIQCENKITRYQFETLLKTETMVAHYIIRNQKQSEQMKASDVSSVHDVSSMKDIEESVISMAEDAKRLIERMNENQGYSAHLRKSFNEMKILAEKIANKIGEISDVYIIDEKSEKER